MHHTLGLLTWEARTFSFRVCIVAASVVALGACGGGVAELPTQTGPVTFIAANDLVAPVTLSVDGSPYAILSFGRTTQITLPANARLTWTSSKPADAHGEMIADEIGVIKVDVSAISGALEITNVIENQTYFTARLFNFTNATVSIGVFDGAKVWCAAVLPGATTSGPGFTLIGYYRLLSTTELRAYTGSSQCTGPYVTWPSSQLAGFEAKSGLLTLSLESSP